MKRRFHSNLDKIIVFSAYTNTAGNSLLKLISASCSHSAVTVPFYKNRFDNVNVNFFDVYSPFVKEENIIIQYPQLLLHKNFQWYLSISLYSFSVLDLSFEASCIYYPSFLP